MVVYKFNPFTGNLDIVSIEDLSGYVPYTGAINDVDLGVYSITAANFSGNLADGVTATTQSAGDNSTKVATTEYVETEAEAREHYDKFIDANGSGDYTSIATAVATEPANTTFFIRGGTYTMTENIVLKTGQQLIGESKETVIIDQNLTTYKIYANHTDNVVLKNFSLINGRNLSEQLDIYYSDNCIIEEIYMASNRTSSLPSYVSGLMIEHSHDCFLNNVTIEGYLYNFKIEYSNRTRISNVYSKDAQAYGFRFRSANYSVMNNVVSYYDGSAVYFRDSDYAVITNIAVEGVIYGFYFYAPSTHNTITNFQGTCYTSFAYFRGTGHDYNTFIGVDLPVNFSINSNYTKMVGCSINDLTINAGATNSTITGCKFDSLTDNGTGTSVIGCDYSNPLNILNQNTAVSIGTANLDDRLFIFGEGYEGSTNLIRAKDSENNDRFVVKDDGNTFIYRGNLTLDTGNITANNLSGTNTGDITVTDSDEIDFTLTGQDITAVLKVGSIDESKLDTSVNASLDLADSAIQVETDPVFTASQAFNIDADDITNLGNLSGINTGDQDLSGLVPYTGATTNVNLGSNNLQTTGALSSATLSSGNTTISGNLIVDTDLLYVDSVNNKVGIGTNSPDSLFHVDGASGTPSTANSLMTLRDSISNIAFQMGATSGYGWIRAVDQLVSYQTYGVLLLGNNYVSIGDGADNNQLYLDTVNKYLGINTTSPVYSLDVNGSIKGNNGRFTDYLSIGTTATDDRLYIFGEGYTGSTNLIRAKDSENNDRFIVKDNGNTFIYDGDLNLNTGHIELGNLKLNYDNSNYFDVVESAGGENLWIRASADGGVAGFASTNGTDSYKLIDFDFINFDFSIAPDAEADVKLFKKSSEGDTKLLKIYGYRTAGLLRSLDICVGRTEDNSVDFSGLSKYIFDGNIKGSNIYLDDTSNLILGDVDDYSIVSTSQFNILLNCNDGGSHLNGGDYNIIIGEGSGVDITSGASNICMGHNSGANITTSSNNIAIGDYALFQNRTSSYNIAIGVKALEGNYGQSFTGNVAIGNYALNDLTTSDDYNVGVGYYSGYNCCGDYNIHLGYYSGKASSSYDSNYDIKIGYQTGDNSTGGSNNILIGKNIDKPIAGSSNTLNIGNLLFATNMGGEGTTSKGLVGIGVSDPDSVLEIANPNAETTVLNVKDSHDLSVLKVNNDSTVDINGTTYAGDGGTTNYTEIKSDGEINLHGTARVKKVYCIPAGDARAPGSSPATYVSHGINGAYEYSRNLTNQTSLTFSIPVDMDITEKPTFKLTWSSPATTGDVKWQIEYQYLKLAEVTNSTTADETLTKTITVSSTSNNLLLTEFSFSNAPTSDDKLVVIRLSRLGGDVADTAGDVAHTFCGGFEYVANKLGKAL